MFKKVWSADMVESHILMTHSNKEPLNSHYYATHYPSVYAAAERLFGSWGEAITACGFNYNEIRKYKVWNRSKVTETIREMAEAGRPISSQKAQRNHKSLYMAAIRYYKSWGKAVMAAGIDYSTIRERRSMSVMEIKAEIIKLYKANVDLSYCNMRANYQYLLAYGMKKTRRRKLGGGPQSLRSQNQLPHTAGEADQKTHSRHPGILTADRHQQKTAGIPTGFRRSLFLNGQPSIFKRHQEYRRTGRQFFQEQFSIPEPGRNFQLVVILIQ